MELRCRYGTVGAMTPPHTVLPVLSDTTRKRRTCFFYVRLLLLVAAGGVL